MKTPLFLSIFVVSAAALTAQTIYVPGGTGTAGIGSSTNGNVGIGTATPETALQVLGQFFVNSRSNTAGGLYYGGPSDGLIVGNYATSPWPGQNGLYVGGSTYLFGNVGIGTTGPTEKLTLTGGGLLLDNHPGLSFNGELSAAIRVTAPGSWARGYGVTNSQNQAVVIWGAMGTGDNLEYAYIGPRYNSPWLAIQPNGNVGIGTTNPGSRLETKGMVRVTGSGTPSTNGGGLEFSFDGSVGIVEAYNRGVGGVPLYVYGYPTSFLGGNVGIGTTSPTHKLAVNGTIRAKEVIVDTGWSDYVFADNYRLAPLSEVETHIKAERHLPGIPSATEVAEHGVSMGEMQSKLLAKIEELTLHQIAQEKELAAQKQKISALENQHAQLVRQISP